MKVDELNMAQNQKDCGDMGKAPDYFGSSVLANSLRTIMKIDLEMSHLPEDIWPPDISEKRNTLVWKAAEEADRLGMNAYVYPLEPWPIVYIHLPTGQISFHIPKHALLRMTTVRVNSSAVWDGHSREERTIRITTYLCLFANFGKKS